MNLFHFAMVRLNHLIMSVTLYMLYFLMAAEAQCLANGQKEPSRSKTISTRLQFRRRRRNVDGSSADAIRNEQSGSHLRAQLLEVENISY